MKKILITGKGSYIGTSFKKYMGQFLDKYQVDELDMKNDTWREYDFGRYDVVFHVAGLAHSTPNKNEKELYYKINTDLAYDTAYKAKVDGVKQFIFMSSIIVYGSGKVGDDRIITKDTLLNPDNFYGDSKIRAEQKILSLEDDGFKLVILRPPMIYGPNSKGNFSLLIKLSRKTPIFPCYENQRSMLYIDNLLEFIKLMIIDDESGIFHPQNKEYVCTSQLVKDLSNLSHHKILFTKFFNPFIGLFKNHKYINKMFGNFVIDKDISSFDKDYNIVDYSQSLYRIEKKYEK